LGQLGLVQSLKMSPLLKISVVVQAECWYRPVSGAKLPMARGGLEEGSGFASIFGLRQPRFVKNRTAKTMTIIATMVSTIVVNVIGVLAFTAVFPTEWGSVQRKSQCGR
jgi:hypothetical protein